MQNNLIFSKTTDLVQILAAVSYLPTLEMVRARVNAGGSADSVSIHVDDPVRGKYQNDNERKACTRRRYELATIRCAKTILSSWGWKGIKNDESFETYDTLCQRFRKINYNTTAFIQSYFNANKNVHRFMWSHGDAEFKSIFPWSEPPAREIPEDVQRIIDFFDGEPYYPRYEIDVKYDMRRIFVSDRFGEADVESSRAKKMEQWKKSPPIVL